MVKLPLLDHRVSVYYCLQFLCCNMAVAVVPSLICRVSKFVLAALTVVKNEKVFEL